MASGVSSMMRSTPVSCSMARMLRPSRPMILPFISSLGSGTTLMAASDTWSAAQRWMATEMISLASLSHSSFVCCSYSITLMAFSCTRSSSSNLSKYSFAWSTVKEEILSNMSIWLFLTDSASFRRSSALRILFSTAFSLDSRFSIFLSKDSSFWETRRSWRWISFLRSFISRSDSLRRRWISSLPSSTASFFFAAAVLIALLMIRLASSSAEPMAASASLFRWFTPAKKATTPHTAAANTAIRTQTQIGTCGIGHLLR